MTINEWERSDTSEASTPKPNMTAEELLSLLEIWRDKPAEKQMWLANITAFGDKRFEEGVQKHFDQTYWKVRLEEARREAIEQCAKIAEEKGNECFDSCIAEIAAAIRRQQ